MGVIEVTGPACDFLHLPMNPDTAEMAVVDGTAAPHIGTAATHLSTRPPTPWARAFARLRADPARMVALRDCWRALLWSRVLVWVAGVGTILAFGFGPRRGAFNPPGLTRGFGALGDLLAAPAARWDASWYLVIAHYGYRPDLGSFTAPRAAFFPLYPLGIRGFSDLGLAPVLAGVLISLVAFALALYGIHHLTTLELASLGPAAHLAPSQPSTARLAVLLTAFAPMAFFFSAVYTESLYLALSVGLFWCARKGRWLAVGLLGALAAATRSNGVLLLLPALLLYLHGPREDRPPDSTGGFLRYRLRGDALWLLLVPLGMGAYMAYLGLRGGDPLLPFHAQHVWGRDFGVPFAGVWQGLVAGFDGLRQLLSGQSRHVYFAATQGSPSIAAGHNLMLLAFLALALPAVVGVFRRLPLAYGVYVLVALAVALSTPVASQPLMSLPRFLVVLFPLSIWAAAWLAPRRRLTRAALVASGLLMALFVAQFSTWHWVS
jgi:Mannosyltransferase (PIG-V)